MKRPPIVSLQRATVRPGVSRGTRKLDVPCSIPDRRVGVRVHHEERRVVAIADELLAAVDHPLLALRAPRAYASPLPARCRAASGRKRRAARSGSARAGTSDRPRGAGTIAPAGAAARTLRSKTDTFQFWTSLSASPESPRAISSAMQGEGLHLGRRIELHAAELLGHAERADADTVGLLEDLARQPLVRAPSATRAASSARMNGVTKSSTKARQLSRIILCSSDSPRALISMVRFPYCALIPACLKNAGHFCASLWTNASRLLGRHRELAPAAALEPLARVGQVDHLQGRGAQALHHGLGRLRRREQPHPAVENQAIDARFRPRWHLRQQRVARGTRSDDRLDPAIGDERPGGGSVIEEKIDSPGEQIDIGRLRALVGRLRAGRPRRAA